MPTQGKLIVLKVINYYYYWWYSSTICFETYISYDLLYLLYWHVVALVCIVWPFLFFLRPTYCSRFVFLFLLTLHVCILTSLVFLSLLNYWTNCAFHGYLWLLRNGYRHCVWALNIFSGYISIYLTFYKSSLFTKVSKHINHITTVLYWFCFCCLPKSA